MKALEVPNMVRLVFAEPKHRSMGLYFVQKEVIEGLFSMPRESIFCVQCLLSWYDVNFWKKENLQICLV